MRKRNRFELLRDERGASLVELALIFPLFVTMLLGAVDFGRAYYLAIEVAAAAHSAALYGSQNPKQPSGMQLAGQTDAPDVPSLTVQTPTYGCECADGTNYTSNCTTTPSCSNGLNVVYRMNVTVVGTYTPLFPWPGIPSPMTFTSLASMRSAGS